MNFALLWSPVTGTSAEDNYRPLRAISSIWLACLAIVVIAASFIDGIDFLLWACGWGTLLRNPLWLEYPFWFYLGGTIVVNLVAYIARWASPEIITARMRFWCLILSPGFVPIMLGLLQLHTIKIILDALFKFVGKITAAAR